MHRAYHIHSKYGDKVGSCYPELLAKVPGQASQTSQVSSRAPAPYHTLPALHLSYPYHALQSAQVSSHAPALSLISMHCCMNAEWMCCEHPDVAEKRPILWKLTAQKGALHS